MFYYIYDYNVRMHKIMFLYEIFKHLKMASKTYCNNEKVSTSSKYACKVIIIFIYAYKNHVISFHAWYLKFSTAS